ncbi:putative hydrolase YutF [Variibacter gotjawalensis]|uniref:Putative hydrolase YutF n=1 Tax=Variibacter gotjawalensis TaxID=1333996 RepID=A0A0S3PT55_9BRAD|nr:HAD family hydrolase [Variibacter gotjawalensis]NIK49416.1 HAD superfamily hydrolase (TIGR01450 family) [Variibacter gotjawalensis]RZS51268.1 HAD superfamily hydrolase (TIGR01450 family) [Variibacter gotjawalensis]BAT59101.1 putative hydrolase YutF [Variibacter gotjawalensis]
MNSIDKSSYLIDLDGTLVSAGKVLPGAKALLKCLGERYVVVSNNAEHTPAQLSRHLLKIGLTIPEERIILAGTVAIEMLAREKPRCRVLLLASAALQRYATHCGLSVVRDSADVVLVGRDRLFNYEKLERAANAVRAGAELVVANPDLVHPGRAGRVVPESGALMRAILACTGPVNVRVVGKPEAELFRRGIARLGAEGRPVAVIGDNPDTDGAGAHRLGLEFVSASRGLVAAMPFLEDHS